jgi:hypothetical protein
MQPVEHEHVLFGWIHCRERRLACFVRFDEQAHGEHHLVVDLELRGVVGVLVGEVDAHLGGEVVRGGRGVEREEDEDLVALRRRDVEVCEVDFLDGPVDVEAAVVEGEGVDARSCGRNDVVGVVVARRTRDEHVMREDEAR